jgi:phenylacetate-CoA ligase
MKDRARIEALQWRALQALAAELVPANPFQSTKLSGPAIESLAGFKARVPFTQKHELVTDQAAHPPFGTNLTYPLDCYSRFSQTSGSTGSSLHCLDTPESWDWMVSNWMRVFQAAEVTPADRIFFAFSFGPFLGFWTAFDAGVKLGALTIPGGGMRSTTRLRTMLETGATVLCCTPTYALHLAGAADEEGIDLRASQVRRILVAGEPGGSVPGVRDRIEELWNGAQVVDHHGLTEVGPVSYGCPKCPGVLHVIEESYIAEIIDPDTGEPAVTGAVGELVLTNLGRTGWPLLRYRTGDMVRQSLRQVCACGSQELALEGGILSRADDMVVVRGVNVYPGAIDDIVRRCGGVAEYRVEVRVERSLSDLHIEVEPEKSAAAEHLPHRLEVALRDALQLRIPVTLVAPGALPRFELKAKRWIRS